MKENPENLTKILKEFTYDEYSGDLWRFGRLCACVHHLGYLVVKLNKKQFVVHRIAWAVKTRDWPNGFIDHIDGNRVNNTWANLRIVSHRENCMNLKIHREGNAVGSSKEESRYYSQISVFPKTKLNLGYSNSTEQAGLMYKWAVRNLDLLKTHYFEPGFKQGLRNYLKQRFFISTERNRKSNCKLDFESIFGGPYEDL